MTVGGAWCQCSTVTDKLAGTYQVGQHERHGSDGQQGARSQSPVALRCRASTIGRAHHIRRHEPDVEDNVHEGNCCRGGKPHDAAVPHVSVQLRQLHGASGGGLGLIAHSPLFDWSPVAPPDVQWQRYSGFNTADTNTRRAEPTESGLARTTPKLAHANRHSREDDGSAQ